MSEAAVQVALTRRQSVSVPRDPMTRRQSVSVSRGDTSVGGVPHQPHLTASPSSAGAMGRSRFAARRQSFAGSHRTDGSAMMRHATGGGGGGFRGVSPENTYRLGPSPGEEFNREEVEKVLHDILSAFLDGEKYAYNSCSQMSLNLTDVIRRRLKEMNFRRFRFVCHVIIGEDRKQGIECASRCIWDREMDNFANVCYRQKKGKLFAVATVFAVYLE